MSNFTTKRFDVPRDTNYPEDSVQCDDCGGYGCENCGDKGWLAPSTHPDGRRCANEKCNKPLHPTCVAVYCSDDCAFTDQ